MAAGRLAKILEQEYKTKGIAGGTVSATGKRLREVFDVRNILFSGGGIGSVVGKKIFGKGYSATADKETVPTASKITPTQPTFSVESVELLTSIKQDTQISAKNSIVLPQIARDINLTKLNIMKLVRQGGDTAEMKADMFFKRAGERESAYEAQFKKGSPVKVEKAVAEKDNSSLILGVFTGILGAIKKGFSSLSGLLDIKKIMDGLGLLKLVSLVTSAPVLAMIATIAGAAYLIDKIFSPGGWLEQMAKKLNILPTPEADKPQLEKEIPTEDLTKKSGSAYEARKKRWKERIEEQGQSVTPEAASRLKEAYGIVVPQSQISQTGMPPAPPATPPQAPSKEGMRMTDMSKLIYQRFKEAGFSHEQSMAAIANAMRESSLNPNAYNKTDKEESVGLFQMNRQGGLGTGHSVEDLKNPEYNINLAIQAAKKSKKFREARTVQEAVDAFVRDVERPANKEKEIQKRSAIAEQIMASSGSQLNQASTTVADARQLSQATTQTPVIVQDNSKVIQNAGGSAPSSPLSAWDNLMLESIISRMA